MYQIKYLCNVFFKPHVIGQVCNMRTKPHIIRRDTWFCRKTCGMRSKFSHVVYPKFDKCFRKCHCWGLFEALSANPSKLQKTHLSGAQGSQWVAADTASNSPRQPHHLAKPVWKVLHWTLVFTKNQQPFEYMLTNICLELSSGNRSIVRGQITSINHLLLLWVLDVPGLHLLKSPTRNSWVVFWVQFLEFEVHVLVVEALVGFGVCLHYNCVYTCWESIFFW